MRTIEIGGTPLGGVGAQTPWTADIALIQPEPWTQDAACAQTDADMFFPESHAAPVAPKRVCKGCDVVMECLAYALRNNETHGIWGGTSPRERAAIKKRARE